MTGVLASLNTACSCSMVIIGEDQWGESSESVKEISKKDRKSIISTVGVEGDAITLRIQPSTMHCSGFAGRVSSAWWFAPPVACLLGGACACCCLGSLNFYSTEKLMGQCSLRRVCGSIAVRLSL
jgi:hypothetical protein